MKKLTIRQMQAVKNIAKNVSPLMTQKERLTSKIEEIEKELEYINAQIDGYEGGIKAMVGYTSGDLVKKVVETTDKIDANGKVIKVTKYIPTSLVEYSEEDKCYYINDVQLEANHDIIPPSTEGMPGSDFDIDSNNL